MKRGTCGACVQAPRPNDDIRHAVLETEVEKIAVPEAKRTCPECSSTSLRAVGAGKTSTVYDYVGPHFRRRVCQRETLSCRCGEYIVTAAPPERVGEKVQFSASFVAHLVTTKCADNRAQYNLAKEYERLGIPISRSTINSLFHRAGKELAPLVERLFERIRDSVVVQADETSIKLQRATKRAFIWAFLGGGLIGYRFAEDRSGETPRTTLLASPGYIVVDAFTGYNKLLALGGRVRGGCLAHARRKIFEADEKSVAKSRSKLSNTSTPDSVLPALMARAFHVPLAVSSVPPVLKDHWPFAVRVPVVPTGCIARYASTRPRP